MALFSTFLTIVPTAWKVIKPFISTTKETLNVIDTATTLIQKRTSPLIKYVLIVAGAGFSMEQIDALTHIITYFQWTLKTQILAVVFALCLLKMFSLGVLNGDYLQYDNDGKIIIHHIYKNGEVEQVIA